MATGHDYRRRDQIVVAYSHGLIRWRWLVLALSLAIAALAASGGRYLQFISDYRYHFAEDNTQLIDFDRIQNSYTKFDNILFVLAPESGEVFDPVVLDAVLWLTEQSWQVPHSIRVDSMTNFQHTWSQEDDLVVEDLVESSEGLSPAALDRLRRIALNEPLLVKKLVAPDARATAINVTIQFPDGEGDRASAEASEYARGLVGELTRRAPDLHVALTGNMLMNGAMEESTRHDLRTLVPWMYAALVAAMLLFLRSVWGTIGVLTVTALSVAVAMGMAGWLGIPITAPTAMAPTIILTIAIADGVHILVTFAKDVRHQQAKTDALIDSLRVNWQPVFLTSLTTVIGFLSLNFSAMPSFHDLGNITAIGVAAAWFFSVTFLPAFVAIVPYRVRAARSLSGFSMERFGEWLIDHRARILPATVVLTLVCAALIPRLELDDNFVTYFDESMQFRRDTEFSAERLSGIYQMHYSLDSGEAGGINEPAYLETVEAFADWFRAQPGVDHVSALPQTMKRLNKNMHGDDPAYYRLPESRELAAQYLLLYEMSLPYGLDLNNQINVKKSATKVTATLQTITSAEQRALNRRAVAWLEANAPSLAGGGGGAGMSFMFANLSLRNVESMIRGTVLAFALISLVLIVELRSLRLGLLSLVPNVVPTLIAFGVWAVAVGRVGAALGIVTAASLGIIVDATVHFLSKYLRARREQGASPEDAVRYTISTVGTALWVSFLILIAGFAVLSQSTFKINADFGLLISITIGAALLADFLMLPTLLMRVERHSQRKGNIMRQSAAATLLVVAVLVAVSPAFAETPEEKGLAIALEGDRRDQGFLNSTSTLKMVLANKQGETSERELRMRVLEVPEMDEGDKSLIVFDTPRDVKGTAFLSYTHIAEPDDQWLYLPSLKRVKRISSKNKSGPFMGSEFAYEDMSSQEVGKYTYKFLRDEPCGDLTCFVVERYPVYENSGYTRQVVWADHDEYRIQKTEFYDRKDSLLKTLVMTDYYQYLDQYWRSHNLFMENHQTGKTTRLEWSDFEFRVDIDEGDFDKNALKRAR